MALPQADREAYIARASADADLRAQALSLLSSAPRAEGFLSAPVIDVARSILAEAERERGKTFSPGARVGPYEILALLGAGGMGEVYRARDTRLRRDVAIKVLPPELARDRERLLRFEREARAASGLSDSHVVAVFDVGREGEVPYFVSEFVEGTTLRHELVHGSLSLARALDLAGQIASGLAAAHTHGIVHRDLKPENVLISATGVAKIADFGLAKLTEAFDRGGADSLEQTASTTAGTVMGTAGYMAPEQVRGQAADARTDIFAFGSVLFEMLTGRQAFRGNSQMEKLASILRDAPPLPSAVEPGVPPDLDRIVTRCLEKVPDQRFQSTRDLAFALASVPRDWIAPVSKAKTRPSKRIQSLAVLPFANLGADPGLEYLSDGITDGLIDLLSQVPSLRVIARATAFRHRGASDPQGVGRDLNVDAVLTGTLEVRENTLTVSAELLGVSGGFRVWGGRLTRPALDIVAVQEDIAREIWVRMKLKIPSEEGRRLARRYTRNKEAHDLYLQGIYKMSPSPLPALREAVSLFERAVEKDPGYALALARMAQCFVWMGSDRFAMLPAAEAYPKAQELARRAVEADPESADTHAALAVTKLFDWKWTEFETESREAIRLNPSLSSARHTHGVGLIFLRRFDESVAELRRALASDPRSPIVNADLGWSFACARRYDAAIHQLQATLEIEPRFVPAMAWLALTHIAHGEPDRAVALMEEAAKLSRRASLVIATLGYAYARAGRRKEAEAVLAEARERFEAGSIHSGAVYSPLVGLGRLDEALGVLETAYEMRASFLSGVDVYPFFDDIRDHPPFLRIRDLVMGAQTDEARSAKH
jgi:serine/threonine protein kinase/tetratricopeptide (TPR) repeat protein